MSLGRDPQALVGLGELSRIPHLRLPRPEALFARRAERFAALAPGNTLSEFLAFLARVAGAQRIAAATVKPLLARAGAERRPADALAHVRGPEWRDALRVVTGELAAAAMPHEGRSALELVAALPPPELEALADRVLANAARGTDLATGPFVAASLQVYFAALAAQLDPEAVPRQRDGCPCCGSLPVDGVVLGDDKLRYLVCSLCAAQWHHTRVQCTACHEGKDIAYYALEGERARQLGPRAGSVKAEACPACKAYTKLFYAEADPQLEPLADDVATLALDLLMAEEGWQRHGVNLFLLASAEPPPDSA